MKEMRNSQANLCGKGGSTLKLCFGKDFARRSRGRNVRDGGECKKHLEKNKGMSVNYRGRKKRCNRRKQQKKGLVLTNASSLVREDMV